MVYKEEHRQMQRYRKLTTICAAAVLAFGLAACGGGGGTTSTAPTPPGPTDADVLAAVNAAVAAEAAARSAIGALTPASTDAQVADARTKVTAAQTAAMDLPADHSLRTTIGQLATQLTGIETARTVASQLESVGEALSMAQTAVNALHQAQSTAEEVADARTKVGDAQTALAGATAISAADRTRLGNSIGAVDTTLTGIETYRATDAGQLAVAEAAVDAAEVLVDALTDESTPTQAGNAYAALQRAKQAVAAAEELPDNVRNRLNAKIGDLERQARGQSTITMALAEAAAAVAALTADSTADDVADARTKVDAAKTAAADLADDDARKVAVANLDTNLGNIEQARIDDANKPGLNANAMALATNIDGEGTDARPTVTITDGKPPLTGDNKFAASTMSIASIHGWMGNAYSRMIKAVPDNLNTPADEGVAASEDSVVVYNNKGPDVAVGYLSHTFAGSADPVDATGVVTLVPSATGVIEDTITLGGSGSVRTIAASGTDGDELGGTFHGLRGTFACASGCSINVLLDGKFQTQATDLQFTPTTDTSDGAPALDAQLAALTVMIDDPDYMHFGYWMNASVNKKDEPVYMVDTFFGGTDSSTLATVQGRLGSAKYAGKASGLYVRKEVDSSGDPQDLYHGQFTADANLTASFGGATVAAADHDSIKGAITNFMDGDEAIDPTWSVTLEKMGFDVSGATNEGTFDATNTDMFTGTTEGDKGMAGTWSAQFFGETAAVTDDADTTAVDESLTGLLPTGVAGEFSGHFVNGHVLGAFGADQVKE